MKYEDTLNELNELLLTLNMHSILHFHSTFLRSRWNVYNIIAKLLEEENSEVDTEASYNEMNRFPRSPDYLNVATVRGVHPQWAKCVPKGTTQKLSLLLLYTPV
ncbi:hypothetical protein HZH68_005944 [Vespula germanica]|uniref:Uncharacterized protein n=1 Tax=Vespula germanica TaxID=30212 RepID=A0A834NDY9_VESGE|nr:hypothetical protein HZH68_005944 [Vespula germanica]